MNTPTPFNSNPTDPAEQPWWQTTWFIVTMLIFVAPAGAVLMWLYKKMWPQWSRVLLTIWAVVFWFSLAAHKEPAPVATASHPNSKIAATPAAATIGKVGERFEAGGVGLTVMQVYRTSSINRFIRADVGKVMLIVDVVIEPVRRDKMVYNPLYFKVQDADGFEYNASLMAPDPSLKSGELQRGQRTRGNVAFEIKDKAGELTGLVMSYKPMVFFGGYEQMQIDLGTIQ